METLTEDVVRTCFVNASRGEQGRMHVPPDLEQRAWEDLDYLGWVDPRAPQRCYLVIPTPEGPVGLAARRNPSVGGRARMCTLCLTTHSGTGVSLVVAPRAGRAGREGNTVGQDVCTELACSAYARGLIAPPTLSAAHETIGVEQRVARLRGNLQLLLRRAVSR